MQNFEKKEEIEEVLGCFSTFRLRLRRPALPPEASAEDLLERKKAR